MGRNKIRCLPPKNNKIDLNSITDIEGTLVESIVEENLKKISDDSYKPVEPPFKNPEVKNVITWSELKNIGKILAWVIGIIVTVVVPTVWFASSLNSKVENIHTEVVDVKKITKNLTENSIKHSEKIGHLEKWSSEVTSDIKFLTNKLKPNK